MNGQNTWKLRNGVEMPVIGFGTYMMTGTTVKDAVETAIDCGYVSIDCAAAYGNEYEVGEGIRNSGVNRQQLFLTSKVNNLDRGYQKTKQACEKSMKDLGVDYLDLYLIHWPAYRNQFENWEEINLETWRAMTEFYQEGKLRAIGTCNCKGHHLETLMKASVKPMVNQIEYHPGNLQEDIITYNLKHEIQTEAWSPLGKGRVLRDERLEKIAERYGKSVAQICIRFSLQTGVIPIPKSREPKRIRANMEVFDFALSQEDIAWIRGLPPFGGSGLDPDHITF